MKKVDIGMVVLITTVLVLQVVHVRAVSVSVHQNITIDGNPNDWLGIATGVENTGTIDAGEYIWTDAVDDDKGDGDYIYPTDVAYAGDNCADLTEFRVTANMTHLFFLVKAVDVTDPGWSPRFGWSEPAVNIYIDQDPAAETGYNETWVPSSTFWGKYMPIDATLANVWWEYIVVLHGWNVSVWDSPTNFKANIVAVGDIDHNAIEAAVPFTVLGVTECPAGQIWRFVVLTGIISFEVFLEVKETAEQWAPGGGASDTTPYPDVECDAFDGAFYTSNENQYADWSDYDATTNQNTTLCNYPTDVPEGYVDLEFGEGEIVPEFPGGATVTLFGCAAALSVFVIIARKRFPHILEL